VPKRGTFSEVLGVSSSAELDSGRCPKNPPTFEKVGSKLLHLRQPLFVLYRIPVYGLDRRLPLEPFTILWYNMFTGFA
ncbi:MAG: hypothetical protein IJ334_01190, partial [Clostridia bacterium]|nr:hypothetical protein [Clostridia bacterium]